ncbi:hypothetical protein JCM15908A_13020 [Prevotella dentasini JCM 15908]
MPAYLHLRNTAGEHFADLSVYISGFKPPLRNHVEASEVEEQGVRAPCIEDEGGGFLPDSHGDEDAVADKTDGNGVGNRAPRSGGGESGKREDKKEANKKGASRPMNSR